MAASISQTLYDYKIDLKEAIHKGQIVPVAFEKCPLCCEKRGALLCDTCVNKGQFTHTQSRDLKSFVVKQREWIAKKEHRDKVCRRFEAQIEDIVRADAKRTEIETVKLKISLLKRALSETKAKCNLDKKRLSQDKSKRREAQARLEHSKTYTKPILKQEIATLTELPSQPLPTLEDLCDITLTKDVNVTQLIPLAAKTLHKQRRDGKEGTSVDAKSVPVLRLEADLFSKYLAYHRARFVSVLCQRIFPIEEVFVYSEDNILEMSMATALKDACETAFIGGRWVHVDLRGENHCKIIGTSLPDYSGESSAVSLFIMANRRGSDNPAKIPVGNPGYGIRAALGYTAMFTTLVAHVLDVHLPRKCSFRELKDDMAESDFCNFVWRLNQNILHLACSQGVDSSKLLDNLSLQNVLAILKCPKLGRSGAFVPTYKMPVEAELCSLEYESEDDTEAGPGDVEITRDWERVPAGLPSFDTSPMGVSSPVDNNMSATGALFSAANAAAASVTGWFTSYYRK
ncbi:hypothetical protein BsWGS_14792 [Bradybaena similaris]